MQHAKQQDPNESCGLLVELAPDAVIYWPCRNMANSGEEFAMDPLNYAAAEDSGTGRQPQKRNAPVSNLALS